MSLGYLIFMSRVIFLVSCAYTFLRREVSEVVTNAHSVEHAALVQARLLKERKIFKKTLKNAYLKRRKHKKLRHLILFLICNLIYLHKIK